jgi:outer membrane lipoprotein SlyB
MKTNFALLLLVAAGLSGCVQTAYSKSVSVTKDADGHIVQTVETETVTQPGQGYEMRLEKIKGVQR